MTTRKRVTGAPKVVFEVVDVTRSIAAAWLERNVHNNRGPKPRQIAKMVRDMTYEPSRWMITGDTIKITAAGDMIDGGQRSRAVLEALALRPDLKSIPMAVAFNVPREAIRVTDKGAKRTVGDTFKIEEISDQDQAGSITRRVWQWQNGNPCDVRGSKSTYVEPSDTDLLETYLARRGAFDAAVARGADLRHRKIGNGTAGGAAFFVLRDANESEVWGFFDNLISGANLGERSPVLVLRERLIRAGRPRRRGDERRAGLADALTVTEQIYFYVRAWNGYRRDEPMDRIVLPSRGITNANFPKPE